MANKIAICVGGYRGGGGGPFVPAGRRIWRSDDAGTHWVRIFSDTDVDEFISVAFGSSGRVLALTAIGRLYVSTNYGQTWALLGTPFGQSMYMHDNLYHHKGCIYHLSGNNWLAGADGIYYSADNGATWTPATVAGGAIFCSDIMKLKTGTIVAGIVVTGATENEMRIARSTNNGVNWALATDDLVGVSTYKSFWRFGDHPTLNKPHCVGKYWEPGPCHHHWCSWISAVVDDGDNWISEVGANQPTSWTAIKSMDATNFLQANWRDISTSLTTSFYYYPQAGGAPTLKGNLTALTAQGPVLDIELYNGLYIACGVCGVVSSTDGNVWALQCAFDPDEFGSDIAVSTGLDADFTAVQASANEPSTVVFTDTSV